MSGQNLKGDSTKGPAGVADAHLCHQYVETFAGCQTPHDGVLTLWRWDVGDIKGIPQDHAGVGIGESATWSYICCCSLGAN